MCVRVSPVVLASIHNLLVAAQDGTARDDPQRLDRRREIDIPAVFAFGRQTAFDSERIEMEGTHGQMVFPYWEITQI